MPYVRKRFLKRISIKERWHKGGQGEEQTKNKEKESVKEEGEDMKDKQRRRN